jgi:phage terminase large subunit-like protein
MLNGTFDRLTPEEMAEAIALHEFIERHDNQRKFYTLFPDADTIQPDGLLIYARHKYAKHLEFFDAGARYRERCAMAANRTGKTFGMGGYETTCHLTGLYPDWWTGRRFATPVRFWAAGKTNETTRDIVQSTLCGDIAYEGQRKIVTGTGLIPGALIGGITWKQGVADLIDTVKVKHVSGRNSLLGFKSYQQGRGAFEGTAQHGIWLDEEPPLDIYGECLIRTATTGGIIFMTFTPLEGMSETVMQFMPQDQRLDA